MKIALLLSVVWIGAGRLLPQDDTVRWLDYDEALAEAKRTQKPLLVEFRCEP